MNHSLEKNVEVPYAGFLLNHNELRCNADPAFLRIQRLRRMS